jgi:hypothetical protein
MVKNFVTRQDYRHDFIKMKRREMRMWWRYDSRRVMEQLTFGLVLFAVPMIVLNTKWARTFLRMPTEDVNELLRDDFIREELTERQERRMRFERMTMDRETNFPK